MGLMRRAILLLMIAGLACAQNKNLPEVETPPPAFDYALCSDAEGNLKQVDLAVWLMRRPRHLEQVYADAQQRVPRAVRLMSHVERVARLVGNEVAENATSAPCLAAPNGCQFDMAFLDQVFLGSDEPGAKRVKEVLLESFVERTRQRGVQQKLVLSIAEALLAGGVAVATVEKTILQQESRTGAAAAGEAKAVAPGAVAAEAEAQALQAKVREAELAVEGGRYSGSLQALKQARPVLDKPPAGVVAEEKAWTDYVAYYERRLAELEAAERAGPGKGTAPLPPVTWPGYRNLHIISLNSRIFQGKTTRSLWQDAQLPEAERQWSKGMRSPYMSEQLGMKPRGSDKVFYADAAMTDQATLKPGATPRVYTFSIKQRDFMLTSPDEVFSQLRADCREAVKKYGGTVEIRRPGHPLFSREVDVSKVYLIYDAKMVPENLRAVMKNIAKGLGVEVIFQ
jgi:hypothetical protein